MTLKEDNIWKQHGPILKLKLWQKNGSATDSTKVLKQVLAGRSSEIWHTLSSALVLNDFVQIVQVCGLIPVWRCSCSFNVCLSLKLLWHTAHVCRRSCVWRDLWFFRYSLQANLLIYNYIYIPVYCTLHLWHTMHYTCDTQHNVVPLCDTILEAHDHCVRKGDLIYFLTKGTTINDLGGGPEEIEKKNLGSPSPGKNESRKAFPRKK